MPEPGPASRAAVQLDEHRAALLARRQLAQRRASVPGSGVRSSRASGAPSHGRNCRRPPRSRTSPRSRTAPARQRRPRPARVRGNGAGRSGGEPAWRRRLERGAGARAARVSGCRRAARRQRRQGVEEERPLRRVEQADELRLEGRAVAIGQPAAQASAPRRSPATRPWPRPARAPAAGKSSAVTRSTDGLSLRYWRLAERRALLGKLRLAAAGRASERSRMPRQRTTAIYRRRQGSQPLMVRQTRTASACAACNAWCRGRICAPRPRSGRDRIP